MSEPILSIHDLKVNYGGIEAVKGISFEVPESSIITLIGSNGAGKSSTLRTIAGLVKPVSGKIVFRGDDITGLDPTGIVKKGITLVPEGRKIFPDLTVLENLKMGAYLRNDDIFCPHRFYRRFYPIGNRQRHKLHSPSPQLHSRQTCPDRRRR